MRKKLLMGFFAVLIFSSLSMFGMHIVNGIQSTLEQADLDQLKRNLKILQSYKIPGAVKKEFEYTKLVSNIEKRIRELEGRGAVPLMTEEEVIAESIRMEEERKRKVQEQEKKLQRAIRESSRIQKKGKVSVVRKRVKRKPKPRVKQVDQKEKDELWQIYSTDLELFFKGQKKLDIARLRNLERRISALKTLEYDPDYKRSRDAYLKRLREEVAKLEKQEVAKKRKPVLRKRKKPVRKRVRDEKRTKVASSVKRILPGQLERMWGDNRVSTFVNWLSRTEGTKIIGKTLGRRFPGVNFVNNIYQLQVAPQSGAMCGPMALRNCILLKRVFTADNVQKAEYSFKRLINTDVGKKDAQSFIQHLKTKDRLMKSLWRDQVRDSFGANERVKGLLKERREKNAEIRKISDNARTRLETFKNRLAQERDNEQKDIIRAQIASLEVEGKTEQDFRDIQKLRSEIASIESERKRIYSLYMEDWRKASVDWLDADEIRFAMQGLGVPDILTVIDGSYLFEGRHDVEKIIPEVKRRVKGLGNLDSYSFVLGSFLPELNPNVRGHWIAIFVIRVGNQLNWFVMDSMNADRINGGGTLNAVNFVKNILS